MSDRKPLRRWRTSASASGRGSWPAFTAWAIAVSARPGSWSTSASRNSSNDSASPASPPELAISSSADSVSRAEPPPCTTAASIAAVVDVEPGIGRHPAHVGGQLVGRRAGGSAGAACGCGSCRATLLGSVVARTNTTCGGGSSNVLSSAASAAGVSMWTSSRM